MVALVVTDHADSVRATRPGLAEPQVARGVPERARRGGLRCEYATDLELVTENSNMDPPPREPERGGGGAR